MEVLKEKSIKEKVVMPIVEEKGDPWMTPLLEYLENGVLPAEEKKAQKLMIKARQYAIIKGVLF